MNRGKKITGGIYHKKRKLRLYERPKQQREVILGETKKKELKTDTVNVLVGKKTEKAKIVNVEETPQNKFLARQNRLMKGAIIETSLGKARITNRPSQEGLVNAILLKD